MKTKLSRLILPILLSVCTLAGCEGGKGGNKGDKKDIDPKILRHYKDYDIDLEGDYLANELQKYCFDKHTTFVKYSAFSTYASTTADHLSCDVAPSTVGAATKRNEYFYTGKIASGIGTREHVWPCANSASLWVHNGSGDSNPHNVDYSKYRGGGSDLYHVRPSTSSVNTARGNSKYVDFDDPEFEGIRNEVKTVGDTGPYKLKIQGFETTKTGAYQFAQKAEPADEYKGDIARILVYIWIHYSYRGEYYDHEDMIGNLELRNVMGYPSDDRIKEKLCEWNELDPPSETEKLRNDTVQTMQGNRNPFVDIPELMNQLFFIY